MEATLSLARDVNHHAGRRSKGQSEPASAQEVTMLKSLITGIATMLLALDPVALRADDAPPPMPQGKEWCQKNPEKCAEMRKQRQEWCEKNPERCEKMEQRRAERKAWCEKNPEECAKQREERKKRLEEMKARCDADPEKCAEKKQQMREKWQQHKQVAPGQRP
jgi:hypothetical protein